MPARHRWRRARRRPGSWRAWWLRRAERTEAARDLFFFFFQAEDGIRDLTVTGVQTCALPILLLKYPGFSAIVVITLALGIGANTAIFRVTDKLLLRSLPVSDPGQLVLITSVKIGRASCRERVEISVGAA